MNFLKGSFKLQKTDNKSDTLSDWIFLYPFNGWLIFVAPVALLFIRNRILFVLISFLLVYVLFKKLKEEQKTKSKNIFLVEVVLSTIIYAFLVFVLYKMGGHFRETGIY
jgi:ABC-type Fe3+-siderophore transport system permease subunit